MHAWKCELYDSYWHGCLVCWIIRFMIVTAFFVVLS